MCYYADWKVRVSSSAYRQLRWKVYQDARANLQLNDMGIALFLFVDGQCIVEDCDQEVVVGHIGTASCMACGCWDELPRRQIINAPTLTLLGITSPSLKLPGCPFQVRFNIFFLIFLDSLIATPSTYGGRYAGYLAIVD